ncbi:MAG: hypothetical protein E7050_09375 [Lentisphaerae bacterium]|nr:hypothetical protein [Lentisphaerota bacterium]
MQDPRITTKTDVKNGRWIYGRAERETFRQQQLIRAVKKAGLKVGYPGEFMIPHRTMHFRTTLPAGTFPVNCIGKPAISEISLPSPGIFEFTLSTDDTEYDVPCFRCDADLQWESSFDGISWYRTTAVNGGNIPPHREEIPVTRLIPEKLPDGMYDMGKEVFGWINIKNAPHAKLFAGESLPEAQNRDPQFFEQSMLLVQLDSETLRSSVPLAFRYISLDNAENAEISVDALYTPLTLKKHFSCGDKELDDIWEKSVYTLQLCTFHFLIDGVKRDRLPWAGDLAVSLLSMTESFQEPAPVRDTLAVLGSAGIKNTHINGIVDYSLWYLINFDLYEKHFDDPEFLQQEYFRIVETTGILMEKRIDNGLLPTDNWVLIDWTDGDKNCALQILFFMALKAAASLARKMRDQCNAVKWENSADKLKEMIRRDFYDEKSGLFRCSPGKNEFLRHQNFLAVGSIASEKESRRIAEKLLENKLPAVGTPYMKSFEILALIRAGFTREAAGEIRRFWGGMVKNGATTFFEAYGEGKNGSGIYDFYGRPFGLSLCHAWSSAPAFLLPMIFSRQ